MIAHIKTNVKRGPKACGEHFINKSCSGPRDLLRS